MRKDFTDITIVIDRSGSMESMRADAEGGVRAFISEQAKQPGECRVTLIQFDCDYEIVFRGLRANECPAYSLVPRGSTALLDAVGRAINETGSRLAAMPETERPALVIFVITTDGQENASREFNYDQIRQMIATQQTVYKWQFTFLAANAESFAEGGKIGIARSHNAQFGIGKVLAANLATSEKVVRMRKQVSAGDVASNEFTDEELRSME